MNNSNTPSVFNFDSTAVRTTINSDSNIMFCAKDVCTAIDIEWKGASSTLKNIPDSWKGIRKLQTPGGEQSATFISEPALYRLIFRSNKPAATNFANWVCEEVLPTIRKQGFYGEVSASEQIRLSNQMIKLLPMLKKEKDAFVFEVIKRRFANICNLLGEPMPDINMLGQEVGQLSLI